jgi:hypothetical protein
MFIDEYFFNLTCLLNKKLFFYFFPVRSGDFDPVQVAGGEAREPVQGQQPARRAGVPALAARPGADLIKLY